MMRERSADPALARLAHRRARRLPELLPASVARRTETGELRAHSAEPTQNVAGHALLGNMTVLEGCALPAATAAAAVATISACQWRRRGAELSRRSAACEAELEGLREQARVREDELVQLRKDVGSRDGELERLLKSNRQLAQQHQALAGIPPRLVVPEPPKNRLELTAGEPGERVLRLQAELDRRRNGGKRRAKRREPLTIDSAYDVEGSGGRPAEVKVEMNAAVCEALRRCDPDLESWVRADTRHILLVIDSPALGSAAALVDAFPGLANSQQIVIPQYDTAHYVQSINSPLPNAYVGVRMQRLDQWLCANASRKFQCRLFLADVESAFLGHQNRQLCPADDLLRYLRYGYAADRSVLVLTFDMRSGKHRPLACQHESSAHCSQRCAHRCNLHDRYFQLHVLSLLPLLPSLLLRVLLLLCVLSMLQSSQH